MTRAIAKWKDGRTAVIVMNDMGYFTEDDTYRSEYYIDDLMPRVFTTCKAAVDSGGAEARMCFELAALESIGIDPSTLRVRFDA